MWLARLSTFLQVATSTTKSAIAGTIAHTTSLLRDAAGTSSDFAAGFAAEVDRKIAISATMQAAAAIKKIVSASG